MRERLRSGLFLAGVATTALATVLLQIVATRMFSALFGHHLAFLAISLSLFGVGLGGAALTLAPRVAAGPRRDGHLAALAALASGATTVALVWLLRSKPIEALDKASLGRVAALYLVACLPFALAGTALAGAIREARERVGRVYLVDLLGAAAGGVLAIPALRLGAPRAMLAVTLVLAAAALAFATAGWLASPEARRRVSWPLVSTFALGGFVLALAELGAPWIKMPDLRWVQMSKVDFSAWNELALVTVDRPSGGMAWMRMDGSAATAILDHKTTPPPHPDEMVYQLPPSPTRQGPALVIGAGGGRDIRAALRAGVPEVHAAEINPLIVEQVMKGRYAKLSGGLFSRDDVKVTVADGRSFVRAPGPAYRSIVISLVDTWAAASVGALALTENSLYTVEAFEDYLARLEEGGALLVNRWDGEVERLLVLSSAALRARGSASPAAHLFACSASRSTAVLVKKTPLEPGELATLKRHCEKLRFRLVFAPDTPSTSALRRLVDDPVGAPLAHAGKGDLRAPTDDRPFFFYTLRGAELVALLREPKRLAAEQQGLAVLFGVLVVSLAFSLVALALPPFVRRALRRGGGEAGGLSPSGAAARALGFFFCIGLGFVLVEVSLVQHLTTFLGHPVYALSTVLVMLLLGAGLGALATERVPLSRAPRAASARALALALVLTLAAAALPLGLRAAVGASFGVRLALASLVALPLGALLGSQAPLGVRITSAMRAPGLAPGELVAWGWGLNGFASVVGTALGMLVALHLGYSALLWGAAACYWLAAVALPRHVAALHVDDDDDEADERREALDQS